MVWRIFGFSRDLKEMCSVKMISFRVRLIKYSIYAFDDDNNGNACCSDFRSVG